MAHAIYLNDSQYRSYEIFVQDRNRQLSKPNISSGTYTLYDCSGGQKVPTTNTVVTSPNIVSFFIKPSSGSNEIGEFSEVWKVYIGSEDFTYEETLYVKERF
jgi:hypothetical protein